MFFTSSIVINAQNFPVDHSLPDDPNSDDQFLFPANGNHGGYVYEAWHNWGDTYISVKENVDFYTSWSEIGNALARKSVRPGAMNQTVQFDVSATKMEGNVFYGV